MNVTCTNVRGLALRASLNLALATAFLVAGAAMAVAQTVALPGGPLPAGVEPPGCHVSAGGAVVTCDSIVDAICFEYEQQDIENQQALAQRQRSRAPFGLIVRLDRAQRPLVLGDMIIAGASRGEAPGSTRFRISEGAPQTQGAPQTRHSGAAHFLMGDGSVRFSVAGGMVHGPVAWAPNQTVREIPDGTSMTLLLSEATPALQQALRTTAREGATITVQVSGHDRGGRYLQYELTEVHVTSVQVGRSPR